MFVYGKRGRFNRLVLKHFATKEFLLNRDGTFGRSKQNKSQSSFSHTVVHKVGTFSRFQAKCVQAKVTLRFQAITKRTIFFVNCGVSKMITFASSMHEIGINLLSQNPHVLAFVMY